MSAEVEADKIEYTMQTQFLPLPENSDVEHGLALIRAFPIPDNVVPSTNYYLVNDAGQVTGEVTLHQLVMATPQTALHQVAQHQYLSVFADDDKEEAARLFSQHDVASLPVLDKQGCLVGVLEAHNGLKIIEEEDQEDIERMMGITGEGNVARYQDLSVIDHIKNRIGWLVALALMGFISGSILFRYEAMLDKLVLLAIYLPMMADTGGNAGGQSASVIIRALAIGELTIKKTWSILRKELCIAIGLGVILALVALLRVWFFTGENDLGDSGEITIGLLMMIIALALFVQVVTATLIGAVLPLIVSYFRRDPAVIASPAITTIVDITGLLIYFSLASRLLGW